MGNICTYEEKERIVYLESKLEEHETRLEDLMKQNKLLRRENSYCLRRLDAFEHRPAT